MTLEVRSRSPAYTGTLSSGAADARATRDEDEEQAALSTYPRVSALLIPKIPRLLRVPSPAAGRSEIRQRQMRAPFAVETSHSRQTTVWHTSGSVNFCGYKICSCVDPHHRIILLVV